MRVVPLLPFPLPVAARRSGTAVTVLALLVAAACGSAAEAPVEEMVVGSAKVSPSFAADGLGRIASARPAMAPPPPPVEQSGGQGRGQAAGPDSAISTMLIRRGDVTIRVDSLEPAMEQLRRLAASLGGTVGNVSVTAGDYSVRSATLELRIPAPRFDAAMGGLTPIGKVEQSGVSAEDVGEEYVDVRARIANAKRLETRLVELLATRTGKLEDVLAVERELARVREEIERNEGRLRWLGSRVATSTISVTVHEPAPIVGETPGQSVIGQAFVRAWQNFVGLVAAAIASLGVLVPAGAGLWLVVRWWQRRRPRGSMEA